MVDGDILLSKADAIQRALKRIKGVTGLDPNALDNQDKQDIFLLNLQRAIQSTIDLASHVVASENLGLPDTVKGYFVLLESAGILNKNLAERMRAMTGFRNIAINEYEALNLQIVKSILVKHLSDLEEFYLTILKHYMPGAGGTPASRT
ncbi:DUF86 domain-containing protein [bacterium]|nr:DUF86 domain-containing protein [bacterium]MCI0604188.1 DUF86 domain-containing protein [bacterium]